MIKEIKEEVVPCEICGHSVIHNEYGLYQDCPQCGWRRGGDNVELERQWGVSYPMLVSLSHAREQYRQGLPFKADFDEFVRGLLFYSEMLFDHQGETYEAYLYRDKEFEPYKFVFCCAEFLQEYTSEEEFREKANIQGRRLKDIWDQVQEPRYM